MDIKHYNPCVFLIVFLFFTTISSGINGAEKLFVFGDSYVDTGNFERNIGGPWVVPYGSTFPHKPSGRFSDGRIIADYIASFIGIQSPIPYQWRKLANETQRRWGMNFAHGGTGVFDTWFKNFPKLKTQINFLKQLSIDQIYNKQDLANSIALVSTSGNDYSFYLQQNGTMKDMPTFTRKLVNNLAKDLKEIHELGIQKIAVAGLGPAGCYPQQTILSSFKFCNKNFNLASKFHNHILQQALRKLNYESKKPIFTFLNFYKIFTLAINQHPANGGNMKHKNPLRPCCEGVTINNGCGELGKNGEKKYKVCNHPELSFFWDLVHPSQNGWHSVYLALQPSLRELLHY